jgi:hypothetical protein
MMPTPASSVSRISLRALGAFCVSASALFAAPAYWDTDGDATTGLGGSGVWDTTSLNWNTAEDGGGVLQAWVNGDAANFGGSGGVVTVGPGISTTGINFRPGAYDYTLSGADITMTTASFGSIISTNSGLTATISISNNINLNDAGPSSNNTYNFGAQGGTDITYSGNLTIIGATAGTNTIAFNLYSNSTFTYSGSTGASSRVAFQIGGSGTSNGIRVTLSGSNAPISGTTINRGTLVLDHNSAAGTQGITLANANTSTSNDTVVLLIGAGRSINNPITVASNSGDTATGEVRRIGGEFTSGSASFTNTLTVNDQKQANGLEVTAAGGGRVNFTGSIVGSGAITKVGDGIVAFTRPNAGTTHSGGVTVAAGTLLANGYNSTGSGAVTVNSGATLGGNGAVNGAITLAAGSRFSPGDIAADNATSLAGTFTAGSSFTWNSDGLAGFRFDLGADQSSSDLLAIAGDFIKGSGDAFVFEFTDLGVTPSFTYTLVTFGSNEGFNVGDFVAHGVSGAFGFSGNSLTFTVAAIPEPSSAVALAAFVAIGAAGLRRRRG